MPVFFVGETVECEIKFRYVPPNESKLMLKKRTSRPQFFQTKAAQSPIPESPEPAKPDNSKSDKMFSLLSRNTTPTLSTSMSLNTMVSPKGPVYKTSQSQILEASDRNETRSLSNESFGGGVDGDNGESLTVAWACAQIDCNCYIDESKVTLPKDPLRYNNNEKSNDLSSTSFQPNKDRVGISVYSSKPKILFCNLLLRPNQIETCESL